MHTKAISREDNAGDNQVIVHLGAGECTGLAGYLSAKAARIILIDANPQIIDKLRLKHSEQDSIEIIQTAVSQQPGLASLQIFNVLDASSLRPPTGLLQLYPGLKCTRQIPVETQTAPALLRQLQLDPTQNSLLVIDIPGEERSTLEALQAEGLLEQFAQIQLYCGIAELYEGSSDASRIIQLLQQAGYDLVHQDDGEDPDRPCWLLRRNCLKLENSQLKQQLIALEKEQARVTNQIATISMQFQTVENNCEEQQARAAELSQQLQMAEAAHAEQQASVDGLSLKLQAAEAAITEVTLQRDQQKVARERAEQDKQALSLQLQTLQQQMEELQFRDRLIDQEMLKAEAQIDLIKDILIREKAF